MKHFFKSFFSFQVRRSIIYSARDTYLNAYSGRLIIQLVLCFILLSMSLFFPNIFSNFFFYLLNILFYCSWVKFAQSHNVYNSRLNERNIFYSNKNIFVFFFSFGLDLLTCLSSKRFFLCIEKYFLYSIFFLNENWWMVFLLE